MDFFLFIDGSWAVGISLRISCAYFSQQGTTPGTQYGHILIMCAHACVMCCHARTSYPCTSCTWYVLCMHMWYALCITCKHIIAHHVSTCHAFHACTSCNTSWMHIVQAHHTPCVSCSCDMHVMQCVAHVDACHAWLCGPSWYLLLIFCIWIVFSYAIY